MKNIRFYTIAVLFDRQLTPKVNRLHMDIRYSTDIGSHVIFENCFSPIHMDFFPSSWLIPPTQFMRFARTNSLLWASRSNNNYFKVPTSGPLNLSDLVINVLHLP